MIHIRGIRIKYLKSKNVQFTNTKRHSYDKGREYRNKKVPNNTYKYNISKGKLKEYLVILKLKGIYVS